ncbi:MAG: hypothetical protein R6W80_09260 [Haliea sp.]
MEPLTTDPGVPCVLLPCSSGDTWAVPLNSVAEVLVDGEVRSGRLRWRGRELPVYPPAPAEQSSGLHAVMRGLGELAGDYWALGLRDRSLAYLPLTESDLAEAAEGDIVTADTLAVFALAGNICVIPDLGALQASLASGPAQLSR